MRRKGVPRKNPDGFVSIERKPDVIVERIAIPLAAFSMIALLETYY